MKGTSKPTDYLADCPTCQHRWFIRLRGVTEANPLVRCPRCGQAGLGHRMPPVSANDGPTHAGLVDDINYCASANDGSVTP